MSARAWGWRRLKRDEAKGLRERCRYVAVYGGPLDFYLPEVRHVIASIRASRRRRGLLVRCNWFDQREDTARET